MFSWFNKGTDYNAVKKTGNRKKLANKSGSHEQHLPEASRLKAIGNTRDLRRNFGTVSWAVRKHLDYVADFRFKATCEDEDLQDYLANFIKDRSRKRNFDHSGRHNLRSALRILESSRFIDGDVFAQKLNNRKLQFIEADRVRDIDHPNDIEAPAGSTWRQGLLINDKTQRVEKIRVIRRGDQKNEWVADIRYNNILPLAYIERFDQHRGVSPLLSSMQTFQDHAECVEFALAKVKVAQLFTLLFKRGGDDNLPHADNAATLSDDLGDSELDDEMPAPTPQIINPDGPQQVDVEHNESAEVIESSNPAADTQAFMMESLAQGLKSFDFPECFYDESEANFAGHKGAIINYRKSTDSKKADLGEWLDDWARWQISAAILNGDEYLAANVDKIAWHWVPSGFEWWDTIKEAKGAAAKIGMGLDNPQRIAKETDTDFYENILEIAKARKFAEKHNVPFTLIGLKEEDENEHLQQEPRK